MKKSICLVLIVGLLSASCNKASDRELAQQMIEDRIATEHIEQYEAVQFGELDSAFTTIKETREYQLAIATHALYVNLKFEYHGVDNEKSQLYADSAAILKAYSDSIENAFVPQWIGWKMNHIYRSMHKTKGQVVNSYDYYFDKDVSRIVNVEMVYRDLLLKTFEQNKEFYGLKKIVSKGIK